jgi:hypothetical protein
MSEFLSAHPSDLPVILKLAKLGLEVLILFVGLDRQPPGKFFGFEELVWVASQEIEYSLLE